MLTSGQRVLVHMKEEGAFYNGKLLSIGDDWITLRLIPDDTKVFIPRADVRDIVDYYSIAEAAADLTEIGQQRRQHAEDAISVAEGVAERERISEILTKAAESSQNAVTCSNCDRILEGNGDLFVSIRLMEVCLAHPNGEVSLTEPEANLNLCLPCYDDNWRLRGPEPFYSTNREGVAYRYEQLLDQGVPKDWGVDEEEARAMRQYEKAPRPNKD